MLDKGIRRLAHRLAGRPRVTVLTGAGVSAASGVPTFRGPGGLWRSHRPETLATPLAFTRDPRLVWEWYQWRRQRIASCRPNAAHTVLAAWSRRYDPFTLITQNVDGLHEAAGTRNVLRFHGSIWDVRCAAGCRAAPPAWRDETLEFPALPPPCPYCARWLRPAVVWFGEPIDPAVRQAAVAATACDVFLTAGTSAVVQPAASLIDDARRRGAFTVEINPDPTPAARLVDLVLPGPAEEWLPAIERTLR
jgi:NAD-dependent deacetylase